MRTCQYRSSGRRSLVADSFSSSRYGVASAAPNGGENKRRKTRGYASLRSIPSYTILPRKGAPPAGCPLGRKLNDRIDHLRVLHVLPGEDFREVGLQVAVERLPLLRRDLHQLREGLDGLAPPLGDVLRQGVEVRVDELVEPLVLDEFLGRGALRRSGGDAESLVSQRAVRRRLEGLEQAGVVGVGLEEHCAEAATGVGAGHSHFRRERGGGEDQG